MTARLSKDQRNHVIGVLKAGSTLNDIAHQFGRSRQTIHYLMNRYNRTGYVRGRAKTWSRKCTGVTSLSRKHVNSTTLSFIIARLYGVHALKIISHFVQNNGPVIFQYDNAKPNTTRK